MSKKTGLSVGELGCHNTAPGSRLWPRLSSYLYSCTKKFSSSGWRKIKRGIWFFKQKWRKTIIESYSLSECLRSWPRITSVRRDHKERQRIYPYTCIFRSLLLWNGEREIYAYCLDLNNHYFIIIYWILATCVELCVGVYICACTHICTWNRSIQSILVQKEHRFVLWHSLHIMVLKMK